MAPVGAIFFRQNFTTNVKNSIIAYKKRGEKMAKKYLEKNVLDAAIERLEIIFQNFDNIYFSLSGGKDSSVMVQLANRVAKK